VNERGEAVVVMSWGGAMGLIYHLCTGLGVWEWEARVSVTILSFMNAIWVWTGVLRFVVFEYIQILVSI